VQQLSLASAITLLTLNCSLFSPDGPRDERQSFLRDAMDQWAANGPAGYEYTLGFSCGECPPEWTHPLRIRVEAGEVVSVFDLSAGTSVDPNQRSLTIDELFEVIQDAVQEDVYRLAVKYHPDLGYPISISIDHDSLVADDEFGYSATGLQSTGVSLVPDRQR
jgi:hypothetical protein